MSQDAFASAAGIPIDSYKKYEGGKMIPGGDALAGIVKMGVDVNALLIGESSRSTTLHAERPHAGYVHLPLYDVHASAGNGTLNNLEQAVDVLAFKEDWVRRELRARPEDLNLIYVVGDSMEPDLRSGDIVLVDHTDTMAQREGVYVIRMDGALLVKQLQRLPGGVVKVISRNPSYETFPVDLKQLANPNGFAVVGRVVWACRRF